jgi:hypothetical protein
VTTRAPAPARPVRRRRTRRRALTALLSAALAACGGDSVAPAPPTLGGVDAPAPGVRRSALDSLFGAAAPALATALAAQDSALGARGAAWVDSVVGALLSAPAGDAALRAGGLGTTLRQRQQLRHGGAPYTIQLERTYDVDVTDDAVVLRERDEHVVVDMALASGEPMTGPGNSYRSVLEHRLRVAACPDANGVSAGAWEGARDLYTAFDSPNLAGDDNWQYALRQGATATLQANVNLGAEIASYGYDLRYTVLRAARGLPTIDGAAAVRRDEIAPGALLAPLADRDVSSPEGDYAYLARQGGDVQSLHRYFAFGGALAFAQARRVWRSGRCVAVEEPGGPVQPASPGARVTLRPFVTHRRDGSRVPAPIDARAEGGSVSPAGELVAHPASFAYTASATGAGRVRFTAVTRRGIGHGEVTFRPLESGSFVEYESSTHYALDTRDEYGEVIAASVAGAQRVSSRLTLVPRPRVERGDVAAFAVLATTDYVVDATGTVTSRGFDGGGYAGDLALRLDGSGATHNPARPGEGAYDGRAPERYLSTTDTAGVLRLYRANGRHVYELDLGLTQVVPRLELTGTQTAQCRDPDVAPRSTVRTTYSNATRRYVDERSDPGECFVDADPSHTRDLPFAFGAISVVRPAQHPVSGSSAMFTGTYDPTLGVLEGEESLVIRQCPVVLGFDPLQLASVLTYVPVWRGDLLLERGGCRLEYTVRWRFFVPPA